MRRIIDLYCYQCNTEHSKYLESDTKKIECPSCEEGTAHKCVKAPMFNQKASQGSVDTKGNLAFDQAGKKSVPPRSYPDEADIERTILKV